jgi:threonine synthase
MIVQFFRSECHLRTMLQRSTNVGFHHSKPLMGMAFLQQNKVMPASRFFSTTNKTSFRQLSTNMIQDDDDLAPGMESNSIALIRETLPVTFADISRANVSIRCGIKKTTCEKSYFLSELLGANIFLKTEFRQFTGSFKERGARNSLLHHLREKGDMFKNTGAIAASAGNHALALAYHGKELGVPVTVVMPTVAPMAKVEKCKVRMSLIENK